MKVHNNGKAKTNWAIWTCFKAPNKLWSFITSHFDIRTKLPKSQVLLCIKSYIHDNAGGTVYIQSLRNVQNFVPPAWIDLSNLFFFWYSMFTKKFSKTCQSKHYTIKFLQLFPRVKCTIVKYYKTTTERIDSSNKQADKIRENLYPILVLFSLSIPSGNIHHLLCSQAHL